MHSACRTTILAQTTDDPGTMLLTPIGENAMTRLTPESLWRDARRGPVPRG